MAKRQFDVYRITNTVNGKAYIGITMRGIERRWKEHLKQARFSNLQHPLHAAMATFGVQHFTIEHLACATSAEDLCAVEQILIRQEQTSLPLFGYNAAPGTLASATYLRLADKPAPPPTTYFRGSRKQSVDFTLAQMEDMFAHYDGGWKIPEIAQEFGASPHIVKRCVAFIERRNNPPSGDEE